MYIKSNNIVRCYVFYFIFCRETLFSVYFFFFIITISRFSRHFSDSTFSLFNAPIQTNDIQDILLTTSFSNGLSSFKYLF